MPPPQVRTSALKANTGYLYGILAKNPPALRALRNTLAAFPSYPPELQALVLDAITLRLSEKMPVVADLARNFGEDGEENAPKIDEFASKEDVEEDVEVPSQENRKRLRSRSPVSNHNSPGPSLELRKVMDRRGECLFIIIFWRCSIRYITLNYRVCSRYVPEGFSRT